MLSAPIGVESRIWLSTGGRIRQLAEPVLIVLIFGWALALVLVPLLGA